MSSRSQGIACVRPAVSRDGRCLDDAFMRLGRHLRRFGGDERGSITAFMLMMMLTMFLMGGMAIDFIRHETARAELQYGLDRGILAAASLDQTVDAETTIRGYLESAAYLDDSVTLSVNVTDTATLRRVQATASFAIDTFFLRLAGIPTLAVNASGTAMEGRSGIEISLILDISGSMAWSGRLGNLIPAAQGFVSQVLTDDNKDTTTINLVPYAGNTNPGTDLFDILGGSRFHTSSSCLEVTDADFAHSGLPSAGFYNQVPNFHWWPIAADQVAYMDFGWCPSDAVMPIEVMSNDRDDLLDRIAGLRLHDGTGTHIGMKWGLALLDPTSGDTIDELIARGVVDDDFSDRPAAWDDSETTKYIVLMTDGQITDQHRPAPPYVSDTTPPADLTGYDARMYNTVRDDNRDNFFALCQLAKDNGVIVFTIAFEVPAAYEYEMEDCASSPAHFYSVTGLSISTAFDSIATTINQLKLVN